MKKYEILTQIKNILIKNALTISSAESCTGGLISSYLTDIDGASAFVEKNFVTYSNAAKNEILNVNQNTLNTYGAVSEQTAYEMALGLLNFAPLSIATTGILGPTGGSFEKPIGLVYIGLGYKNNNENKIEVIKYISKKANTNDRHKIKKDITKQALFELLNFLKNTLN